MSRFTQIWVFLLAVMFGMLSAPDRASATLLGSCAAVSSADNPQSSPVGVGAQIRLNRSALPPTFCTRTGRIVPLTSYNLSSNPNVLVLIVFNGTDTSIDPPDAAEQVHMKFSTQTTGITVGGVSVASNTNFAIPLTVAAALPATTIQLTFDGTTQSMTVSKAVNSSTLIFTAWTVVSPAPTVTAIAPNSGTTAGGTAVTITGTNFTGATTVTIGGAAATGISVVSPTSITATTPAGTAGTASVLVTTPGGTNAANTLYTYDGVAPVVAQTKAVIGSFMRGRAAGINNNQPGIVDFINGTSLNGSGSVGSLAGTADENGFNFAFSSSLGKIWSSMDANESKAMGGGSTLSGIKGSAAAGSKPSIASLTERMSSSEKAYGSSLGLDESEKLTSAQERGYDVWTQIYGARSQTGTAESTLWVGYLGGHAFINPDFLIGGLVQADWTEETDNNSRADGFGWMVGPYIAARLPGQPLFFDARASWGKSDNNVSPSNTYEDSFETERWRVSAKLSGAYEMNGWTIRPSVSVSYFEETQQSYIDSLNNLITEQTFALGEVRFGPSFSNTMLLEDGTILQPNLGVTGVWNFDVGNDLNSQGSVLGTGDLRARFDAGFKVITTDRLSFDINGYYDGLGVDDYHSYGGKVRLSIPLQ